MKATIIVLFFFSVAAMAAMEAQAHVYYFLLKEILREMMQPSQYAEKMFPEGGLHQFILELDADTLDGLEQRLQSRGISVVSERVSESLVEKVYKVLEESHENDEGYEDEDAPTPLGDAEVAGGQDLHRHAEQVLVKLGEQFAAGIIVLERNFDGDFELNLDDHLDDPLDHHLDPSDFDAADEQVQILLGHAYGNGHGPNVDEVQEAVYEDDVETGASIMVKYTEEGNSKVPYLIVPGLGNTRSYLEHGNDSVYLATVLELLEEMLTLLQTSFLKCLAECLGVEEEEVYLLYSEFQEKAPLLQASPPPGLHFYGVNEMREYLQYFKEDLDDDVKARFLCLMLNPPEKLHKLYYAGCETQILKGQAKEEQEGLEGQQAPLIQGVQQHLRGGKWIAAGLSSLALFCIAAIAMTFWSLDKQRKAARKGASFPNGYENCPGSVDSNRSIDNIH